jgi:hypothetical protein
MSSFFSSLFSDSTLPPNPPPKPIHESAAMKSATKRGVELIKLAVLAEQQNNPSEALRLYTDALAEWVEILRVETDEDRKKNLAEFIHHYMQRAEVMKTIVAEQNKIKSDFKNYTSPTISSTKRAGTGTRRGTQSQPHSTASARQRTTQKPPASRGLNNSAPARGQGAAGKDKENEYETQMLAEMLDTSPGVR